MGDSSWQSCVMCGHVVHDSGRGFSSELLACLYHSRPEKTTSTPYTMKAVEPPELKPVIRPVVRERQHKLISTKPMELEEISAWQALSRYYRKMGLL